MDVCQPVKEHHWLIHSRQRKHLKDPFLSHSKHPLAAKWDSLQQSRRCLKCGDGWISGRFFGTDVSAWLRTKTQSLIKEPTVAVRTQSGIGGPLKATYLHREQMCQEEPAMRDKRFTRGGQRSSRIPLLGAWHWMQMGDVQSPPPPSVGGTGRDRGTSAVNPPLAVNRRPPHENDSVPEEL